MRFVRSASWSGAVVVLSLACGNGSGADGSGFTNTNGADASVAACPPGATSSCACNGGPAGTQVCTASGTPGTCACTSAPPLTNDASADRCNNLVCEASESCKTCPRDCGECPKCELAPSCTDGLALPAQTTELNFDDLSKVAAAPTTDAGAPIPNLCLDAQLRLRIARVDVGHQGKQVWLPTGTISGSPASYYCIVQASDGFVAPTSPDAGPNGTMEVAITRPTAAIPDFQGADFAPTDSIFWGQTGPRISRSNLTLTYSCFQQKETGDSTWETVLKAGSQAAGGLAGAGPYGWAFGLGSIGLAVAGAAVAAAQSQGDWHMFDVTQTIDKSQLLELTNGHRWSFERSGGESAFHYPWKLKVTVESWGCAEALPPPPH